MNDSIVDPNSGKQPILSKDKKTILAANGEIYNHRLLRGELDSVINFQTGSDCEIILALYQKKEIDFLNKLNGILPLRYMMKKKPTIFNYQGIYYGNYSTIWMG